MIPARIVNGEDSTSAKITNAGELVTGRIKASIPKQVTLDLINTAYLLVSPISGQKIVIRGVVINADRDVGNTTGAIVEIYSTPTLGSLTGEPIFTFDIIRNATIPITNIDVEIEEGLFIYAKTSDDDINLTLLYYQV